MEYNNGSYHRSYKRPATVYWQRLNVHPRKRFRFPFNDYYGVTNRVTFQGDDPTILHSKLSNSDAEIGQESTDRTETDVLKWDGTF